MERECHWSEGVVSTIIPVYNRSQMLTQAVQSVLAQTYRPLEIIIVDDGSTDDTPRVAQELSGQYPDIIKVVRQENVGPGVARNAGLAASSGEFIQYLDSDDLLEPAKFERQVTALRNNSACGVCYCITLRRESKSGQLVPWAKTDQVIENIFPSFLPQRGWATLTPLWRRSVCEQIGPWGDFRVMEDWEHDLRAGMLGVKPVHVAEPLCVVRDHEENRASGMNTGFTPALTRDFFRAHESVWLRMREKELTDWSYLQRFSRTMFWIARLCGQFGLTEMANLALDYTDQMTDLNDQSCCTVAFRRMKSIFGWKMSVWFGALARRLLAYRRSLVRLSESLIGNQDASPLLASDGPNEVE